MSFASEKNKVIISESEVPPTLSTSIFPCHRNPRQEVKEKFPGKRRLSKDSLFSVAMGLRLTLGFTYPAGERFLFFMKVSLLEQMAETPSLSK